MRTKRFITIPVFLLFAIIAGLGLLFYLTQSNSLKTQAVQSQTDADLNSTKTSAYWFVLQRKSNTEKLLKGIPGDENKSELLKTFTVKTGMPGERPTPLPQLLGREYWILIKKEMSDNPETAPYFLTLDVPISQEEPYGPEPYLECNGQCDWVTPGYFGLHGTGEHPEKLLNEDPESSGCIRHSNEDITYLYNLLNPEREEIRYYINEV